MSSRRSCLGLALVLGGFVALLSTPAHAIFGFGVHAGKDFVSVDEGDFGRTQFENAGKSLGISANWALWDPITLTRKSVSNPWLVGGHFYVDALPFFDIELSGDVALQKYQVIYTATNNPSASESGDFYFGRAGAYLTVRRDLIKLPPLVPIAALYLGGGLGYHYVAPVAGADLIVNAYKTEDPSSKKPDIGTLVEREGSFGWHALVGVRVKPPIIPLAFRVEGKYTNTGISTYERPGAVFSAYVGTSIAF